MIKMGFIKGLLIFTFIITIGSGCKEIHKQNEKIPISINSVLTKEIWDSEDSLMLENVLPNKGYLMRISENHCHSCVEFLIDYIEDNQHYNYNITLVCSFSNPRDYLVYKNVWLLNSYLLTGSQKFEFDNNLKPFIYFYDKEEDYSDIIYINEGETKEIDEFFKRYKFF